MSEDFDLALGLQGCKYLIVRSVDVYDNQPLDIC